MNIMKRSNQRNGIWGFLILLLIFVGCQEGAVYSERQAIDKDGWMIEDTITFSPEIDAADMPCDIYIWVRHEKDYSFSNVWLKVMSDQDLVDSENDLVEIALADKTGQWLGTCSQSLCTKKLLITERFQQDAGLAFRIDLVQYMRESSLSGIRDAGIEIVRSPEALEAP